MTAVPGMACLPLHLLPTRYTLCWTVFSGKDEEYYHQGTHGSLVVRIISLMADQGTGNRQKYLGIMIYVLVEVPKHQALTQQQHHQLLSL